MIRVVTDSTSQLTEREAAAAGISVVPMTIVIDGIDYLEGVDLSAEAFYELIGDGVNLTTSQPSPAAFLDTYNQLIDSGATEIVSVHVSEASSGTLNSARLASAEVTVPVHLIDSKMTSYGLAVIADRIAMHVAHHGDTAGIENLADTLIPTIRTVFILQDRRYILRGGRMRREQLPSGVDDVPVLAGTGGGYQLVGTGRTIEDLVDQMAASLLAGDHLRDVAIALAGPDTIAFTERLEHRMHASEKVASVHRYRMGPSIAVHTGPGTAGGFSWPADQNQ